MNSKLIFFSSYEMMISIVFGLVTIFITYRSFDRIFLKKIGEPALKSDNKAVALLTGTVILTTLILVQNSILPSVDTLQSLVVNKNELSFKFMGISFLYFLGFYSISMVLSMTAVYFCIGTYIWVTRDLAEIREIKSGNLSVSILLCLIILGFGLFLTSPIKNFMGSLVKYDIGLNSTNQIRIVPKSGR